MMVRSYVLLAMLAMILASCGPKTIARVDSNQTTDGERKAMTENRGPGWEYEKVLDQDGTVLEEGWKYNAPPDHFERDGLSHLDPYVEKLLASKNWFSALRAGTPDGTKGVSIRKKEDQVQIHLFFDWRREGDREKRARAFFARRGIMPRDDYLAGNGGVPDAVRVLSWPVRGDGESLTELVRRVASEVCEISETAALNIKFEEHPDERGNYAVKGPIRIVTTPSRAYGLILNLVRDPRTPLSVSVDMVAQLSSSDIKSLAEDETVPEAVRKHCQKLLRPRESGDGPR